MCNFLDKEFEWLTQFEIKIKTSVLQDTPREALEHDESPAIGNIVELDLGNT